MDDVGGAIVEAHLDADAGVDGAQGHDDHLRRARDEDAARRAGEAIADAVNRRLPRGDADTAVLEIEVVAARADAYTDRQNRDRGDAGDDPFRVRHHRPR